MRPALDPAGHRVPRTKPTCLLHTWRPHRRRPFALVLHLHQHESSRNLHLQYLAKNQSTQRCQSLITQGSDHPPVLEPHMVLTFPPSLYSLHARTIHRPSVASRRPPRPLISPPLSLCPYLKPSSSFRSPFCTCNAPTHAPGAPHTHSIAAPVRRSAGRPAAVVELHHCRLPFARELARLFFTW
jgi:hypothetical protein